MDVVDIMNRALPQVSLVVVAIIMLMVLLGIFGGEAELVGMKLGNWVAVISLIIIIWIFGAAAGWWGSVNSPGWGWLAGNPVCLL